MDIKIQGDGTENWLGAKTQVKSCCPRGCPSTDSEVQDEEDLAILLHSKIVRWTEFSEDDRNEHTSITFSAIDVSLSETELF